MKDKLNYYIQINGLSKQVVNIANFHLKLRMGLLLGYGLLFFLNLKFNLGVNPNFYLTFILFSFSSTCIQEYKIARIKQVIEELRSEMLN